MEITIIKESEKYIRNLARCRNSYEEKLLRGETQILLENTMAEIQNLLAELGIDLKDYSGKLEYKKRQIDVGNREK